MPQNKLQTAQNEPPFLESSFQICRLLPKLKPPTNGVTKLQTFITFDADLGFQPSTGHFHLKFYTPSYYRIKNEKRWIFSKLFFQDGDQIFF